MTESTARAERISPESSAPPSYIWQVPDKPLAVGLPFVLIDRMEKEVVESFRSLTSRGSEIGGLLLGSVAAGNPPFVSVDDYETIDCDYSRGPLYRLSDADMGRLERAMEQRRSGSGLRVVGFFRSHTRKGLCLDAEDVSFFEARFRDATNVMLLVRPFATKASTAGIFIWENGALRGEQSSLEFPFRSSQLAAGRPMALAAEAVSLAPAAVAPPSKPAIRGQIVPIASRREITMPAAVEPPAKVVEPPNTEPAVEPAPAAKVEPAPAAKVEPAPVAKVETKPAEPKVEAKVAPKVEAKVAPKVEAKVAPQVEAKVEKKAEPKVEKKVEEPVAEKTAGSGKAVWLMAVAAILVFVGVGLFVYPGFLRAPKLPPAAQGTSALSLRVERTGADILLTWNREAPAIKHASHAVLTITDGERHENYDMDLARLGDGSIVYSPVTPDVSFKMEVSGLGTPVSESVRVLRTRPSPMPEEPAKPVTAAAPVKPEQKAPTAEENSAQPESKPSTPATPVKPFDVSSLSQRLRPASPSDVPEAPVVNAGGAVSGAPAIPGLNLNTPVAAPPPPPVRTAPPAAEKKAVPTGGQIKDAELVFKRPPEYPRLARQMGVRGSVELVATIGTDGHVKSVKVAKGHPLLTKAATEAVMQWIYKPTMLNGVPVENDTRIVLNFLGEN